MAAQELAGALEECRTAGVQLADAAVILGLYLNGIRVELVSRLIHDRRWRA